MIINVKSLLQLFLHLVCTKSQLTSVYIVICCFTSAVLSRSSHSDESVEVCKLLGTKPNWR